MGFFDDYPEELDYDAMSGKYDGFPEEITPEVGADLDIDNQELNPMPVDANLADMEMSARPGDEVMSVDVESFDRETPKAWLLSTEHGQHWFPKSKCGFDGKTLKIPRWLYGKKF